MLMCGAALGAVPQQFVLEEHPTLRFSKDTFVLGRMRWDFEHRGPEVSLPSTKDGWGFVRRRFSVEGGIGGVVAFEIETDLEGTERWKDVYVAYTRHRAASVRAGKFVVPFSYERTTSIDVLDFAYRSMGAVNLVPPRDRGVMVYGELAGRRLTYETGWFEDGDTLAGRIVARPGHGVEIGAAVTRGSLGQEMAPLRGLSALGVPFFTSVRAGDGHRRRLSVHGVYRAGSAAFKAEYAGARDAAERAEEALAADAWYVSGSYVLTGESEGAAHHPKRPLFAGGVGSIEVAARTESLAFDRDGAGAADARAHTVGVNWQPIRFFRIQLNAIRDELPGRRMWTRVFRMHLTI